MSARATFRSSSQHGAAAKPNPLRCSETTDRNRAVGGMLQTIGILLGVLWYLEWIPAWTIWPAVAIWISALFVIFEALIGWCAVRAMGVKTPI
jgi:hypothetical protein